MLFSVSCSSIAGLLMLASNCYSFSNFENIVVNDHRHLRGINEKRISTTLQQTSSDNNVESRRSLLQKSANSLLLGLTTAAAITAPDKALAAADNNPTTLYFGTGCFWHIQHEFVEAERSLLKRKDTEITSRTGYAGGLKTDNKGRVCYHNLSGAGDYGRMGHGEVVGMTIPENSIESFAKLYFDLFDPRTNERVDPGDAGGEYRYLLGLPGGDEHPAFSKIQLAASNKGKKLVKGKGGDPDTYKKGIVYYYDTKQYPFYQAEIYHQFHNDFQSAAYGREYNSMSDLKFVSGEIKETGCPEGMF